jgi:hypothetical protein
MDVHQHRWRVRMPPNHVVSVLAAEKPSKPTRITMPFSRVDVNPAIRENLARCSGYEEGHTARRLVGRHHHRFGRLPNGSDRLRMRPVCERPMQSVDAYRNCLWMDSACPRHSHGCWLVVGPCSFVQETLIQKVAMNHCPKPTIQPRQSH